MSELPPTTETKKSRRRLVPDSSDTIEVGGERLTRVMRLEPEVETEELTRPLRTIDDVARKHLGEDAARAIEENSEFIRALGEASREEELPIEKIVDRVELFTEGAAVVPASETDPSKRDGMTMGPLVSTEEAPDFMTGREPPRTLYDLFEMFPLLDGDNWFINVDRVEPRMFGGLRVNGTVRKLTRPVSLDEWQEIYGGGTYKLTVYGPPKRGLILDVDGRTSAKRMTEPITVIFPGPPSTECMYDLEGRETMSQSTHHESMTGRRGPLSNADASVDIKRIDTAADREKRLEVQARDDQKEKERMLKEKASEGNVLLAQLLAAQSAAAEREASLRQQMLDREKEIAEQRRSDDEKWEERIRRITGEAAKPDDVDRFVKIMTVLDRPDGSVDALRAEHTRELERLQRQAQEDRDRADRLIEDEKKRCQDRINEVEKRAREFEAEIRSRADKEIAAAKDESERRLNDLHRQYESSKADMDRNHQRDLAAKESTHAMAMETQKQTYEMRLENTKGEVKRTAADVERYRKEAEANKDVVGAITKLKEDASKLGMVDASEAGGEAAPMDWKQMLITSGGAILQGLPGILENIATAARGKNAAELQAAREQGRREMEERAGQPLPVGLPPAHRQRRQLASGELRHMSEVTAPSPRSGDPDSFLVPMDPQQQMAPRIVQPPPQPVFAPEVVSSGSYVPPPPGGLTTGMPPEPQMAPPAPAPSVAPPPMAAADPAEDLAKDRAILEGEALLRPQYEAGVPPSVIVQHIVAQYGPEAAGKIASDLESADRVILAFERSGDPASPFQRRDGKKFLRELFVELEKALKQA